MEFVSRWSLLYSGPNSIEEANFWRAERGPSPEAWAEAGDDSCIKLFCDSQSAIYFTKDQMFHERTKHIDVKYHYVRYIVEQGKLKVCKISTHDNPADMMTKPVPIAKFELCSSLVGITV